MNRRRILLIAVAGVVLLFGGLILTVALIPEERIGQAVAQRAEAFLGEPVAIDRVGLAVFPLPGVRLEGLSVGADSSALASVERAEVRVGILPLLSGRVVVRTLVLDAPRISVEIDRDGVANFPVLEPDTAAAQSTADIAFAVDRIRINDGALSYTNHQDGTRVRIDGWNQRLAVSGAIEEGALASLELTGWVGFDAIEADLPGAVLPARDLALRIEHDAALDLADDRLQLRELAVDFDGVTLAGSGEVAGVNSGRPDVRIDLSAVGLDAGRLLAWVPDSLRARLALPDGRPVGVRGTAALRVAVVGTVAPDALPAVDGQMELDGVAVTIGDAAILDQVAGQVVFSLDSVVTRFDGRLLGEAFNAGVAVRDPSAPVAVVAISGQADLGAIQSLGLIPDTLGIAGTVRMDLRGQVAVDDPAASRASGTVDANGIDITGLALAVRVPTASARFDGGSVRVDPFRVEVGPDRNGIEMVVIADGWIPAAVDTAAPLPQVRVALQAEPLNLDSLMGERAEGEGGYAPLLFARLRDRPIDGRTAAEIAEELGLAIPPLPPVNAEIDARFERLIKNDLTYTDMTALASVTPDAITLEQLRFGFMGGVVDASGRIQPLSTDSANAPLFTRIEGRYGVTGVGAGPFFTTLTPFKDHLDGRLDMAGTVGMTMDRFALPERLSLEADGTIAISQGHLANWAVVDALGSRLGVATFDTLWFQDWDGRFRVDGPRVTLDETVLDADGLSAGASGWFDFGGQLDVSATAALEPAFARSAGAVGRQLLAASPDGRVPVAFRIHGTVESPSVTLDLSPARDLIAGRAAEAAGEVVDEAQARVRAAGQQAEETARETVEEAADEARDRVEEEVQGGIREGLERLTGQPADSTADSTAFVLPDSLRELPADSLRQLLGDSAYQLLPDSVRLRADSLQQALQNALRERLRRLLPGGGGGDGGGGG